MKFIATTSDSGSINLSDLLDYCKARPSKQFTIEIKQIGKRGLNANGLYWIWNEIVASALREYGNEQADKDLVHEISKLKCNPTEQVLRDEVVVVGGSTATMSKTEFSDYMSRYQKFWQAIIGFELPQAGEQFTLKITA